MDIKPHKSQVVRGRETHWYRVPMGREMRRDPMATHGISAKIENLWKDCWNLRITARFRDTTDRYFGSLGEAETWWRGWLERRTTER